MKPLIVFCLCILLITVSCSKIGDPKVSSFQLVFTEYSSGDTLPNVPFNFRGTNSGNYNFNDSTNDFGNFDTVIEHVQNSDFYLSLPSNATELVSVEGDVQIQGGTNTSLNISLIQSSKFEFIFDCSAPGGYIENASYYRLPAILDTFPLPYHSYAQPGYPTINCGYNSIHSIFPGDWVIRYEYRLSYSSTWTEILDTVSVLPGEVFDYTILY